jgi:hypothetical protein
MPFQFSEACFLFALLHHVSAMLWMVAIFAGIACTGHHYGK